MKLSKIAAAAALTVASVGSAMASIALPNTGNGELFLVVFDPTDQVSYVRDFGLFMDDFSGTADFSSTLSDENWTTFLSAAGTDNLFFAVMGGDSIGSTSRRLFTTINSETTPLTNNSLTNSTTFINDYANYQVTTSLHTTHPGPATVNGTSWDAIGTTAYFLNPARVGTTFGLLGLSWTNSVAAGTDALFRSFGSNALAGGNPTLQSTFDGVWRLTSAGGTWTASYTVTPIPEANAIGMMAAGLGVLGFVARRRRPRQG